MEAGTDSCLDSACWKTKLGLRVEQVITEQQELAGQQPVVRLSSNYWQPPTGSIAADKYEVVKRKKGTVVGVYVDGAQAGKVVRVELAQDTAKAVAAGKTELSQGEKNRDARHQRLLKETGKQVLAERCYHALQAPTAEAKQGRIRVLASVVAESLMQGRNLDLVTLAALASTWKWEPVGKKGPDTKGLPYREWVVAQVLKCAPTEALLAQLLLFSVTHRGLGSEWNNYQQTAAALIKAPQLQEGLAEATEQEFERLYDPRTLRLRKEPLEATPVQQLPVEESDEQADEEHGIAA